MKIACIGGGPAGLYLGILVKRRAPEHDVVVFERNRPAETFGFGVVFSDATLGNLAAADPETHGQITSQFARWDDIEVHVGGEVLRSTGHGFCGLERKALLQILQDRARALGVRVVYEHEIRSLAELPGAPDVVVGCDGVASGVRDALAAELRPAVDVRPNKFVWLGCTVPYPAFTFVFKPTIHGLFRVHAYRYREHGSTFIVECRDDTWRRAGLAGADEAATVAILEAIFADELAGHRLIKNRSIWRNFPTVRCARWHAGNTVLLGDAAHTAHFSIGSGTKLAMEDAIALADELLSSRDITSALAAYEARRRPEVEALQAAAQASLEWFEGTERYLAMAPVQFTYSLMTRSLRVSHASVSKRDPHLARGVEQLLASALGLADRTLPPSALPFMLGDRRARSRVAVSPARATGDLGPPGQVGATHEPGLQPGPDANPSEMPPPPGQAARRLVEAARAGAGLVATGAMQLDFDPAGWRTIIEPVHDAGALIMARLCLRQSDRVTVAEAATRAAAAGFDAILLDPGDGGAATEQLPAAVAAARTAWRPDGWIAAVVCDRPETPAAVIDHAAQVVRAGAQLLWVPAPGDGAGPYGARLPAAPLADRLRNELGVATAIECGAARLADLDAAIAAGRADLVVIDRMPNTREAPDGTQS